MKISKSFSYVLACLLGFVLILSGCSSGISLENVSKNITHYTIEATLNNNKTLTAKQTVAYINKTGSNLNSVMFHLYPNAFRSGARNKPVHESNMNKAYPGGFDEGKIDVLSLNANNTPLTVKTAGEDKNILDVTLPTVLKPNSVATITIGFSIKIPKIAHRFGYGENTINLGNFYPVACMYENGAFVTDPYSPNGDPFFSDIANYSVKVTHPGDLTLASTGYVTQTRTSGMSKIINVEAKAVRDFAMVFAKFSVLSQTLNNTKISYFYYGEEDAQKMLNTCVDAVRTFNDLFGKYPYSTLNVVKTNFLHGGMEYPNLVYISDSAISESEYRNVIVHEIAHQWWYAIVGNDEVNHAWLDEGLTEFSTALFYKYNDGYENTYEAVTGNALSAYLLFADVYKAFYGKLDSSMTRCLYDYTTEPEYVYMTYVRGLLMFDSIMEAIGERKMVGALAHYYKENAFKIATPESLILALEKSSRVKLRSLIESWLDGRVVIEELNG